MFAAVLLLIPRYPLLHLSILPGTKCEALISLPVLLLGALFLNVESSWRTQVVQSGGDHPQPCVC